MSEDAGFGLPLNQHRNEPIHWWTPNGRAACRRSDDFGMIFAGDRFVTDEQIEERGVCAKCLFQVMTAAEVLGMPMNMRSKVIVAITSFGRR